MTDLSFSIRHACPDDARAIAEVQVASWRTTYPGIVAQSYIDSLTVEAATARWRPRLSPDHLSPPDTFVAEQVPGNVVGFVCGGPIREPYLTFEGELYAIYLVREAQRMGMGRWLIGAWAQRLSQRGFRSAVVRVLSANPARHFYERLGARAVKQAPLEIGGRAYPETWYAWDDITPLVAPGDR